MDAPADAARKIWQPIHPAIRAQLDPQYVSFHDEHMQYVQPDELIVWDAAARTQPGLPSGGSKPVPVGSIRDVDLGRFPVRVYTPAGECDENGWPVLVWFHGGAWVMGGLASGTDFCCWVCRGMYFTHRRSFAEAEEAQRRGVWLLPLATVSPPRALFQVQ